MEGAYRFVKRYKNSINPHFRTVAVQSKVDNLLKKIIDPSNVVDLNSCEVRTIMSAIKALFRNLREPVLTFENHETIIGKRSRKMD